jgi:hypothetical protein
MTGALLAGARIVIAVEKGALFGDHQGCFAGLRLQLQGRQRYRDLLLVKVHFVAVNQPLVRDDVVIGGVEGRNHATFPTTLQPFASAGAHINPALEQFQRPGGPLNHFCLAASSVNARHTRDTGAS